MRSGFGFGSPWADWSWRSVSCPRQELRSGILRNLDVFSITPDTFGGSKKNIENIPIPKKSDVNKKLSELEEEKDWLDLSWLYD